MGDLQASIAPAERNTSVNVPIRGSAVDHGRQAAKPGARERAQLFESVQCGSPLPSQAARFGSGGFRGLLVLPDGENSAASTRRRYRNAAWPRCLSKTMATNCSAAQAHSAFGCAPMRTSATLNASSSNWQAMAITCACSLIRE